MRSRKDTRRPAAFLDRDGVLNRDLGFVHRKEDFVWMPGARRAIRRLNASGYRVIVITNQSGVARGFYSEEDVIRLHSWMNQDLRRDRAHIDAFYYCPHHPMAGMGAYHRRCDCRKPAPGMLLQAIREWSIDPAQSFLIGDKNIDLQAARSAGIRAVLTSGGDLDSLVARILARTFPVRMRHLKRTRRMRRQARRLV